jgi:hypothetical protein
MPRKSPSLTVVSQVTASNSPRPPRQLGSHGKKLWDAITSQYEFSDPGSVEILAQACGAVDRSEACRAQIETDGLLLRGKTGATAHPLLRDELANRQFAVRALSKLGLDLEPLHDRPGMPSGGASRAS